MASVFAPGSPFDPSALLGRTVAPEGQTTPTTLNPNITLGTAVTPAVPEYAFGNTSLLEDARNLVVDFNSTLEELGKKEVLSEGEGRAEDKVEQEDFTFVILLLTGIVTSRFGEWQL